MSAAGNPGEKLILLAAETSTADVESAAPQLVPLEPVTESEDLLQIQYRGADLRLPAGVDMDAVAALLRSLQSL